MKQPIEFDYLIIGAGLAGSVLAERLASKKNKKILIIEKKNHIGGNCYDYKDTNNILIHKYGPHIFHTDNKIVFDYLSQFTEWNIYNHKVLAMIDGKNVTIPFNLNTLFEVFPQSLAEKLESTLLKNFKYNSKIPILELKQSTDIDLQFLANYIYENIFLNYTAKQWGMNPEEIDSAVTARVPIFIGRDNRYFNDTYQALPKEGYTKLFENILDHPNIKILLNSHFNEICSLKANNVYLFGKKFLGKVIYTGPIDELFDFQFEALPYRSVDMHFETIEKEYYQEAATVNYPNNYNFTRITEFKHMNLTQTKYTTILKEYPQPYTVGKNIPYYPIFTAENQTKYNKYLTHLKHFDQITLLGRLAEYKYYDMDDIVEKALKIFEEGI